MSRLLTPVAWLFVCIQSLLALLSLTNMGAMYMLAFVQSWIGTLSAYLYSQQLRLRPQPNTSRFKA